MLSEELDAGFLSLYQLLTYDAAYQLLLDASAQNFGEAIWQMDLYRNFRSIINELNAAVK